MEKIIKTILTFNIVLLFSLSFKESNYIYTETLSFYVDNNESATLPGKNEGYLFDTAECTNGASLTWDDTTWGANITNLTQSRTKCRLRFANPSLKSVNKLARLNSNYTYTANTSKCATLNANGSINNPSNMGDNETPIICEIDDDYGKSYYLRGNHQDNNVKFADFCWKILRITGTGGIKLIYNGEPDANGKCTTTSGNHKGVENDRIQLSGSRLYGSSYTYDGTNYTLTNTETLTWSSSTANTIIGKYTCGNTSSTCTELYEVIYYFNSNYAYVVVLNQDTNYASIGDIQFSMNYSSPAYTGYMFYKTYSTKRYEETLNGYFGSSFTYNNGTYTLTNPTLVSSITDSALTTRHYTCFSSTGTTCTSLNYIFYSDSTYLYYIILEGNETGPQALNKMIANSTINVHSSTIKAVVDWWYKKEILSKGYNDYIEDSIFCGDRGISNYGSWSETGPVASSPALAFNGYNKIYYLTCQNKNDRYTVSDTTNGNGALTYPVGLISAAESALLGNNKTKSTGAFYWTMTPDYIYAITTATNLYVSADGTLWDYTVNHNPGARPVISLKNTVEFSSGDGTASNPFIVQ